MQNNSKVSDDFAHPTLLPELATTQQSWQESNRAWWENNPMRYDWNREIQAAEFSPEFFEEIDRRHFQDAAHYSPPKERPFDRLIPFASLPNWDVLEIGVGNGSHAQLLAPHCKTYTGIDLTEYAVGSTQRRFAAFNLQGDIRRMDAERMDFPDNSFDFIWSWGVIHHSADTAQVLREMQRVLRPGGVATTMVYHRSFFYYYVFNMIFKGILGGQIFKSRSLHKLVQSNTDGALARFFTIDEWRLLVSKYFVLNMLCIKGQKSEMFPLPAGRLKTFVMNATPDVLCRFMLNKLSQGTFLISSFKKT